ncbi:MAG: signal peptidase I [Planctomycetaceae bacterium]
MRACSTRIVAGADRSIAAARELGAIRQLAEAALLLAVAVILFRGFVAEGYMISTGSMAPCLLGYHRQIVCPDCAFAFSRGTRHDIDDSILAQGSRERSDFGIIAEQATVCPNCGFADIDIHLAPRNEGDQLLVQKNFFQWRSPRRWEVVVFRHPDDAEQAYVKRVVGLPFEEIQLVDGDVFVNGGLQRKTLTVQRSMRIGVYDNDFEPLDQLWEPRWRPSRTDSGWSPDGHSFRFQSGSKREGEVADTQWLGYRHWLRSGGNHRTSVTLDQWPDDAPAPANLPFPGVAYDVEQKRLQCTGVLEHSDAAGLLAMTQDADFQLAVQRLEAQSHVGPITDVYGYNHPQSAEVPFAVHDLMIEFSLEALSRTGQFCIRMHDGWHWFDAVIDFDEQRVRLFSDDSVEPLRSAALPRKRFVNPVQVEMSLFDRQVLLAVDGQEVFPALRYAAENEPRELPREPVLLGASGGELRIEQLRLYRDVYYTPKHAGSPGDSFFVGAEELFVLGDNSPVSVDSRLWDSTTIPERLLSGKPFLVHLPSKQERVEIGGSVRHIRIPDFSRVRYIQ